MSDDPWDFSRPVTSPGPPARPVGGPPSSSPTRPASPFDLPGSGPAANPFGDPPGLGAPVSGAPTGRAHAVGPPLGWLLAAVVAAVVGLVVAALTFPGGVVYLAGWFVAGPVAVGMLAIFARQDAARQTAILYSFPAWKATAYRGALVLSLLAVLALALRIADWAGHL